MYCNAGLENASTLWGVRALVQGYFEIDTEIRARIVKIVALHVSFVSRTHLYMVCSARWDYTEYPKVVYCNLIQDLENILGVDAILAGVQKEDIEYDEIMRTWVGRENEGKDESTRKMYPDPSKPLLNFDAVDFSTSTDTDAQTTRSDNNSQDQIARLEQNGGV